MYTFGLFGRLLWTVAGLIVLYLLLAPLVHLLRSGLVNAGIGAMAPLFFAVAGVILLVWVGPRFVRDVWRPASVAGNELTELRDQMRREAELLKQGQAESDAGVISQREAPSRW